MERTLKAGFKGVRESHGYVIQRLIESEQTITELARRMEVPQQAASKMVTELIGLWIIKAISDKDRRSKRICLSKRGWRCVQLGRQTRERMDERLIDSAELRLRENESDPAHLSARR